MKKIKSAAVGFMAGALTFLAACGGVASASPSDSTGAGQQSSADSSTDYSASDTVATYCNIYPVGYSEVNVQADMQAFYEQTRRKTSSGGTTSNDGKLDYGFVDCVYYTLTLNGKAIPVYSARCGYNVHSFAWADVDTDGDLRLDAQLSFLSKAEQTDVVVLPEKSGVVASFVGDKVEATLNDYGSFSFVFDGEADMALTVYVAPASEMTAPDGWKTQTFQSGKYTREQTAFTEEKTLYYFQKGVYDITCISLPSDSILYFERGTSIRVYEESAGDYYAALQSSGTQNIKILGRALFDFSKCMGGDAKTKGVYSFSNVTGMQIEGVVTINSNNWSMCFNRSENAAVSRCMFFSYRTYADGVMFSDCKNSSARDCFVRTGDDAMEVKAFTDSTSPDCYTDGLLFENNCVWTDKGIAYGCIYESKHDIRNVIFRNNSVGFAQASWSEHLGCCTMQMGSQKSSTWENVYFENMEVYKTSCALLSVFNRANNQTEGGKIKNIYFKNITAKYAEQTNLPVYALSVVIRLGDGATWQNSTIGALYLDRISYAGTAITAENYKDYIHVSLDDGALFPLSSIKINTREEEE